MYVFRHGFPIVPDFGGTAHAYRETTMEAAIGDLLPWFQKPRLDDMLEGYIIKSRVRDAEKLLLAQPYSPHLFRQGTLPGPQLLLYVLMNKPTFEVAKKQWHVYEQQEKQSMRFDSWLLDQALPCRCCTDQKMVKKCGSQSVHFMCQQIWMS